MSWLLGQPDVRHRGVIPIKSDAIVAVRLEVGCETAVSESRHHDNFQRRTLRNVNLFGVGTDGVISIPMMKDKILSSSHKSRAVKASSVLFLTIQLRDRFLLRLLQRARWTMDGHRMVGFEIQVGYLLRGNIG